MTRDDDIIRMAIDSGLYGGDPSQVSAGSILVTRLKRFAALVEAKAAAAEREACATIDVTPLNILASDGPGNAILKYRAAILARGAA